MKSLLLILASALSISANAVVGSNPVAILMERKADGQIAVLGCDQRATCTGSRELKSTSAAELTQAARMARQPLIGLLMGSEAGAKIFEGLAECLNEPAKHALQFCSRQLTVDDFEFIKQKLRSYRILAAYLEVKAENTGRTSPTP